MATFRGKKACACLIEWLPVYEAELLRRGVIKNSLDIYQLIGGAVASGGTHSTGGAFDIGQTSAEAIKVAREMGADATWHRPKNWDGRGGMEHTHGVLTGCPHLSWQAKVQQVAVKAGRNGLANLGKDTGPRPLSKRTYKQGIAWAKALQKPDLALRIGTWNLPAEDKIPNGAGRIERAAQVVAAADLAIIGWNELQPTKRPGIASSFASDLDAALGSKWLLVKPTRTFNENYISYDSSKVSLVTQYEDSILEAPTGGRHITRAVFKDKNSGVVFAVGQAHLVNGTTAAHDRDRKAQGVDAVASMLAVNEKHNNCPIIIQGDFNLPDRLPAFAKWKRTREFADESTTRNAATYTNYAKTKPSTNPDWAIDQQEVTPDLYVVGYSVLLDTNHNGNFNQPRPSDHNAVIASLKLA